MKLETIHSLALASGSKELAARYGVSEARGVEWILKGRIPLEAALKSKANAERRLAKEERRERRKQHGKRKKVESNRASKAKP